VKRISPRGLWAGLLAAGVVGAAAIAFTGSAAAEGERAAGGGGKATIKMKIEGRDLDFFGDRTVGEGEKLTVVNKTSPRQIGPHTFTLVKPSLVDTRAERRACVRLESRLCRLIFRAHEVGPPPDFPVGKPNLDFGKRGWDKEFTKENKGDSWFTAERGAKESRKVRADAGETLSFFCIVHPNMRGKIEVTG
jgi:plastocyanin